MQLKKSFQMAMGSILTSKVRSFLTMLGIIIGVAAVIILISLMDGVTGEINSVFDDIGTNVLNVRLTGRGGNRSIDPEDFYRFLQNNDTYFDKLSPTVSVSGSVKIGNETLDSSSVQGVGEDYETIGKLTLTQGRFLQYIDIKNRQKVCVVGNYISHTYFKNRAIGQTVKINGNAYTIVGVLEEKGDSTEGSADDCIYLPYTNAAKLSFTGTVDSYSLTVKDEEQIPMCMSILKAWLNRTFISDDYYKVISMQEVADMLTDLTGTLKTVLVCIAGISLLVGGIGIMNIMLVTVTERTREIGIRKSVGAKRRDIMRQFVIEAAVVSAFGGAIGILVGGAVSVLAGKALDMSVYPSLGAILLAFGVSVAIGIIFGYLPASKAAKLNPIDALRHD